MSIEEMIRKYEITLVVREGQEMLRVGKPPKSEKIIEEIKAKKPAIIEELKVQNAEKERIRAARMAEAQERMEREKAEYIATSDLRRCLVEFQDEWGRIEHSIQTMLFTDKSAVWNDGEMYASQARFGLANKIILAYVTETMKAVAQQGDGIRYGLGGVAWEITPEQEAQILAEQIPAKEEAERKAREEAEAKAAQEAEKKAAEEAELAQKYAQARETGKPVIIRTYMVPCSDPREECNVDNVVEYAMPDGTVKREQYHTW